LSRGGERVGELAAEAFAKGCRLDAWDDYIKKDVWRALFEREKPLVDAVLGAKESAAPLPWDVIDSGTGRRFLAEEARKSAAALSTPSCAAPCGHPCGICPDLAQVAENPAAPADDTPPPAIGGPARGADPATHRIVFSFAKTGPAVWLPHLALIEVFSMALQRAGIPVQFSRGFNPLPRLDFASPLSLGVFAEGEIATIDTDCFYDAASFIETLNPKLSEGFKVNHALNLFIPPGEKKHSAASLLWGFAYAPSSPGAEPDLVSAAGEKQYRAARLATGDSLYGLTRRAVLARGPASYFTVYETLDRGSGGRGGSAPQPPAEGPEGPKVPALRTSR
jgi:hypothetical protein